MRAAVTYTYRVTKWIDPPKGCHKEKKWKILQFESVIEESNKPGAHSPHAHPPPWQQGPWQLTVLARTPNGPALRKSGWRYPSVENRHTMPFIQFRTLGNSGIAWIFHDCYFLVTFTNIRLIANCESYIFPLFSFSTSPDAVLSTGKCGYS